MATMFIGPNGLAARSMRALPKYPKRGIRGLGVDYEDVGFVDYEEEVEDVGDVMVGDPDTMFALDTNVGTTAIPSTGGAYVPPEQVPYIAPLVTATDLRVSTPAVGIMEQVKAFCSKHPVICGVAVGGAIYYAIGRK